MGVRPDDIAPRINPAETIPALRRVGSTVGTHDIIHRQNGLAAAAEEASSTVMCREALYWLITDWIL